MHRVHRFICSLVPGLFLAATLCGGAMAADPPKRAVMQPPAKTAAVVAHMPGMVNNVKVNTLSGIERNINDGIVIRQSRIEGGKIIIPPSGLYLTVRSMNWFPFDSEPIMLAGKLYHAISYRSVRDVMRNVEFKEDQTIPLDSGKTRGFQLFKLDPFAWGMKEGSYLAEFRFLKASGNYYGENFPVQIGPKVTNAAADGSFVNSSKQPDGETVPTAENGLGEAIWGTNIATVGRTFIIADTVDGDTVKVREMATDTCSALFISPHDPVVAAYAKGDSFTIGGAKVEVTDVADNSATVTVTDKSGAVTKTFGPLTPENTRMLLMSPTERDRFWTQSKDGKVAVHLNIRPDNPPIAGGKVSLVAFNDVLEITNGGVWPSDPRFLTRPET